MNVALNVVFLYGTTLAQVGIALASSLSGWLNAGMLAVVLRRRGHWMPDQRLLSRSLAHGWPRPSAWASSLWAALAVLGPALAHPT